MIPDDIRLNDLLINSDYPRIPVSLLVDTSGSMCAPSIKHQYIKSTANYCGKFFPSPIPVQPSRIELVEQGINSLYQSIYNDEFARYMTEIAVVSFDDTVKLLSNLSRIEYDGRKNSPPSLITGYGCSAFVQSLKFTIDILGKRIDEYKKNDIEYEHPILIVVTDGLDNITENELKDEIERINDLVSDEELIIDVYLIDGNSGTELFESMNTHICKQILGTQIDVIFSNLHDYIFMSMAHALS